MKRMGRYIAAATLAGSSIALLVILSLELVFAFIDETGDIGSGDYTATSALLYVVLTAPQRAYEAFPMATLIGSLMGLGGLAARNELTAMRAAGFSVFAVARAVMGVGLLLGATAFVLGEWVAPPAEQYAQSLRASAMTQSLALGRDSGFWARDGKRFVQVGRAVTNAHLQGVRVYEFDEASRVTRLVSADSARYRGEAWELHDVEVTRFTPAGVNVEMLSRLDWEATLRPGMLDIVVVEPETLPLLDLVEYVEYLERNGLESARYRLAAWVKIATPFATVALLLLTVPLVFGSARSAGAGQRIFLGVLLGIAFFLANRLLNHAGLVYGLPPSLSALLPSLVFALAGLIGLSRVR